MSQSDVVKTTQDRLSTVAEVARQWHCSLALVYALVAEGRLECYRLGLGRGTIRFTEAQLRQFLDSTLVKQRGLAEALKHIRMPS